MVRRAFVVRQLKGIQRWPGLMLRRNNLVDEAAIRT
jgi:hypothetical protein